MFAYVRCCSFSHSFLANSKLLWAYLNRLTPNDPYMCRTAPLTSKRCILYIYSTNVGTEYFKHALYSPFWCRIHLRFRLMGGLYGKSMTSPRQIPGSPSRLRAQHRKLTAMRYYWNVMTTTIWRLRILHLQQYSRRLNLFVCFFFLYLLPCCFVSVIWIYNISTENFAHSLVKHCDLLSLHVTMRSITY